MSADQPVLADLAELRWEKRLVVVNEASDVGALVTLFEANVDALDERDVAWFLVNNNRVLTNYPAQLVEDFAQVTRALIDFKGKTVVLVGLDGGAKLRADAVDLKELFAAIDSMPMRRYEPKN